MYLCPLIPAAGHHHVLQVIPALRSSVHILRMTPQEINQTGREENIPLSTEKKGDRQVSVGVGEMLNFHSSVISTTPALNICILDHQNYGSINCSTMTAPAVVNLCSRPRPTWSLSTGERAAETNVSLHSPKGS